MADMNQRSCLRERFGPHEVEYTQARNESHSNGTYRSQKESHHRDKHRPKRNDSQKQAKKRSTHHRRRSIADTRSADSRADQVSYELDVIRQPACGILLGMESEMSVMVSLRLPLSESRMSVVDADTSALIAITSLVRDDRAPLEAGYMTGQRMFDSVHPISEGGAATLPRRDPSRIVLGRFNFPGLTIQQAGTYRIRTTLVKVASSADAGARRITAVDSDPIRVEHFHGGPRTGNHEWGQKPRRSRIEVN